MSTAIIPNVTPEEFGKYLRQHRMNAGLSLQQVANKFGIQNNSSVSAWETGHSQPAPEHFKRISEIYGIKYDTLKTLGIAVKAHNTVQIYLAKFKEVEGL